MSPHISPYLPISPHICPQAGGAVEGLAEAGCVECVAAMGQAREAQLTHISPVSPLYLPYISPISPLYHPYISPIYPLYLPYISPIYPLYIPYISPIYPLYISPKSPQAREAQLEAAGAVQSLCA